MIVTFQFELLNDFTKPAQSSVITYYCFILTLVLGTSKTCTQDV